MVVILNNSNNSIINSSLSTIEISERCSYTNSMLIGGNNSDNYNLNLLSTELSSFYGKNIIFNSYNGSIYISGFDQRNIMNVLKMVLLNLLHQQQIIQSIHYI